MTSRIKKFLINRCVTSLSIKCKSENTDEEFEEMSNIMMRCFQEAPSSNITTETIPSDLRTYTFNLSSIKLREVSKLLNALDSIQPMSKTHFNDTTMSIIEKFITESFTMNNCLVIYNGSDWLFSVKFCRTTGFTTLDFLLNKLLKRTYSQNVDIHLL